MPLTRSHTTIRQVAGLLNGRALPASAVLPLSRPDPDLPALLGVAETDIDALLTRRRSTYEFGQEPLSRTSASKIVETACRAAPLGRPSSAQADSRLTILVGAYQVTSTTPGLYLAQAEGGTAWDALGDRDWLATTRAEYTAAPALFFVCGDVRSASEATSGTGYGELLVRAGALGYALWLAALAEGLAGSVFGRSSPDVTRSAREIDPGLRHLFTAALGTGRHPRNHEEGHGRAQ